MAKSGPGRSYRKSISLPDIIEMFDTEEKAESWFVGQRWPDGPICPFCDSDQVSSRPSRKPQPYRCRTCRKDFSVTTGTLLHRTHLPLSKWAVAFYLFATNLRSVSGMKLHRDLGITQKTAWYMAHRIRQMMEHGDAAKFADPVEADPVKADETCIGAEKGNKRDSKKLGQDRGSAGQAVAGVKDRDTNQVGAAVERTDGPTLRGCVHDRTEPTEFPMPWAQTIVIRPRPDGADGDGMRPRGHCPRPLEPLPRGSSARYGDNGAKRGG